MTDLELMYFLEEHNYIPNLENLRILKEQVQICEARAAIKKIAKAGGFDSMEYKKSPESTKARYRAHVHGQRAGFSKSISDRLANTANNLRDESSYYYNKSIVGSNDNNSNFNRSLNKHLEAIEYDEKSKKWYDYGVKMGRRGMLNKQKALELEKKKK